MTDISVHFKLKDSGEMELTAFTTNHGYFRMREAISAVVSGLSGFEWEQKGSICAPSNNGMFHSEAWEGVPK